MSFFTNAIDVLQTLVIALGIVSKVGKKPATLEAGLSWP